MRGMVKRRFGSLSNMWVIKSENDDADKAGRQREKEENRKQLGDWNSKATIRLHI